MSTIRAPLTAQSFGRIQRAFQAHAPSTRRSISQCTKQAIRLTTQAPLQQTSRTSWATLTRNIRFPRSKRWNSSSPPPNPNPTPHLGSPSGKPGLSQRLKALSKEYGWSALGVYLALSALDFPFCFLAVRLLGTERIGHWESEIIEWFSGAVRLVYPDFRKPKAVLGGMAEGLESDAREGEMTVGGVEKKETAGLGTQLVLAYAVHKSLIVFRVPLTAAVLPKVVKTLRGWGWNIGRKPPTP